MNCFRHHEKPAVGVCKSCGKGVCVECAAEQLNGIACKGSCEDRVALMNKMVDNHQRAVSVVRHQARTSAILMVALGVILLGMGVASFRDYGLSSTPTLFGISGGVVFFVTGIVKFSRRERYPSANE